MAAVLAEESFGKTMVKITYDEYDKKVEACEKVLWKAKDSKLGKTKTFFPAIMYPSIHDLEENDVENHVSEYLPYLIFIDEMDPLEIFGDDAREQFIATKRKVNQILRENLVFCED